MKNEQLLDPTIVTMILKMSKIPVIPDKVHVTTTDGSKCFLTRRD